MSVISILVALGFSNSWKISFSFFPWLLLFSSSAMQKKENGLRTDFIAMFIFSLFYFSRLLTETRGYGRWVGIYVCLCHFIYLPSAVGTTYLKYSFHFCSVPKRNKTTYVLCPEHKYSSLNLTLHNTTTNTSPNTINYNNNTPTPMISQNAKMLTKC